MDCMDVDSLEVKRVVRECLMELEDKIDMSTMEDVHTIEKVLIMLANLKFSQDDRISIPVPELFRCLLSKKLMSEPVVISTGETYDKSSIQPEMYFIPNTLLHNMITSWRRIELRKEDNVEEGKEEEKDEEKEKASDQ